MVDMGDDAEISDIRDGHGQLVTIVEAGGDGQHSKGDGGAKCRMKNEGFSLKLVY
jgi:hypothetical protein